NKHYYQDKDWGITRIDNDDALIITEKNNLDYAAQQRPPLMIRDNCYIRYQHPESANAGYTLEIIPCE
ncbi:type II secretion system protein, partial [Vibrio natriegens]